MKPTMIEGCNSEYLSPREFEDAPTMFARNENGNLKLLFVSESIKERILFLIYGKLFVSVRSLQVPPMSISVKDD